MRFAVLILAALYSYILRIIDQNLSSSSISEAADVDLNRRVEVVGFLFWKGTIAANHTVSQ